MADFEVTFGESTTNFDTTLGETSATFATTMDTVVYGEPESYLKNAEVSGATLTLTKKDDTTVIFVKPTKTSELTNDSNLTTKDYVDSTFQEKLTAGTNITISNNVISAEVEDLDWNNIANKPFVSLDAHTLKVTNSVLAVNTADDTLGDNTRPMSAAGVNTIVGNIQVLLEGI